MTTTMFFIGLPIVNTEEIPLNSLFITHLIENGHGINFCKFITSGKMLEYKQKSLILNYGLKGLINITIYFSDELSFSANVQKIIPANSTKQSYARFITIIANVNHFIIRPVIVMP